MIQVSDQQVSLHTFSPQASADFYWATNTESYEDWESISALAAVGVDAAADDESCANADALHMTWHVRVWAGCLPHLHRFSRLPLQTDWKVEMCGLSSSSADSFQHVLWSVTAGIHILFKRYCNNTSFDIFTPAPPVHFLQSGSHHIKLWSIIQEQL